MKKLLIVCIVIGTSISIQAQVIEREVISSGGDNYSNTTAQMSITIGEPIIETHISGGTELTQGFNQTKLLITSIEDKFADFEMNVFPNPTSEYVIIQIPTLKNNMKLSIIDVNGKLVSENELSSVETNLSVKHFARGTYFIKVTDNQDLIKTYKIQKQ